MTTALVTLPFPRPTLPASIKFGWNTRKGSSLAIRPTAVFALRGQKRRAATRTDGPLLPWHSAWCATHLGDAATSPRHSLFLGPLSTARPNPPSAQAPLRTPESVLSAVPAAPRTHPVFLGPTPPPRPTVLPRPVPAPPQQRSWRLRSMPVRTRTTTSRTFLLRARNHAAPTCRSPLAPSSHSLTVRLLEGLLHGPTSWVPASEKESGRKKLDHLRLSSALRTRTARSMRSNAPEQQEASALT